jgi:putative hydroxymethylpyrimidine transport system substrate-binding protein
MRWGRLALAVSGALLLLAGCGGGGVTESDTQTLAQTHAPPRKLQELGVTFDGWHGPQQLGILVAAERGYFENAGLEVHTYTPATPARPIPYVLEGTTDLSVAQLPQVVLAKEKGAPVTVLGSLVAQPTASMIWLRESHLHDLADLRGKTIGYPGVPFQRAFLESALARAGVPPADVKIENVGYDLVSALEKGKVDAIFGASANLEGVKLSARGLKPVITPVEELGAPPYPELVVVGRSDNLSKDPAPYRRFMAAVAKGTATALRDPEEADETVELTPEGEPLTGPGVTKAQVEATLPLLSKGGDMDPRQIEALSEWMKAEGMIEKSLSPREILARG